MKTQRPYKVKLNGITLYDCETIESARDIVQAMRSLAIDSTLMLENSEIEKLLNSKSFEITIRRGSTILETYNVGDFKSYINSAFNRYYTKGA